MMRLFFLQRTIPALLAFILICAVSVGSGMAQSSPPTAANKTPKGLFLNKAPAKASPKEVPATNAASEKNSADLEKKPASQPASQIKIPPVRINIGAQDNRRTSSPTIQVSPQDIAKVQKIMEIMNIGQKSGR
jgi:hypothetical protein